MGLAEELKASGLVTTEERIASAASAALTAPGFAAQVSAFYAALADDPSALLAVFENFRDQAARPILVLALERQRKAGATKGVSSICSMPPHQSTKAQTAGHLTPGTHGHGAGRSAPTQDRAAGHGALVNHRSSAGRPDPQRAAEDGARLRRVAASLLDTFIVNGQPIGRLTPREALGWAGARERDARFVRLLCANLPPDGTIAAFRTADDAARIYAMAAAEGEDR